MKQEMMRWQWHQLEHTQIICALLQTDNHASMSSLNFFTGQMLFLPPNRVKALKARPQAETLLHYICSTAFFPGHQKGKPFWILLLQEMWVAVASAGPHANHLHLAPDR